MRKVGRFCVVTALAAVLAACASRARPHTPAPGSARPGLTALLVRLGEIPVRVPLEEYVAGCVAAELGSIDSPPAAAARMRNVQAILCRSFAAASGDRHRGEGFDLCDSTHCQVYRPAPANTIGRLSREAAARTAGLVLEYQGTPVRPVYHARCGGRTSRAEDVWDGAAVPFLTSTDDAVCRRAPAWRFTATFAQLVQSLPDSTRTALKGSLRDVSVRDRDRAGRARSVSLLGAGPTPVVLRGDVFRSAVMRQFGARSLRSTLFSIQRQGDDVLFEGKGDGHGVGLCQAGAVARAKAGASAEEILHHYFPGTGVRRLN